MTPRGGADSIHGIDDDSIVGRRSPERHREVHPANEQQVDTVDRGDGIDILKRRGVLDLRDERDFGIGTSHVVCHRARTESGCARPAGVAAAALTVTAGRDRRLRRCERGNVRDHYAGGAKVKGIEDFGGFRAGYPYQCRHIGRASYQDGQVDGCAIKRRMLGVDAQTIERCPRQHLKDRWMWRLDERTQQAIATPDALAKSLKSSRWIHYHSLPVASRAPSASAASFA